MSEWTPALSTGVPLLDEQRKLIFQWLAELDCAATEERTLFGAYAITRLKQHTRNYFGAEEALLKSTGYPRLEEHMAEHAAFRAKLAELHVKSIAEDISAETVRFLTDWLTHHIAVTDMAHVPYLKSMQTKSQ